MKIREIYEGAYKRGIELDPRGPKEVKRELKDAKKDYEALKKRDKESFDLEKLKNPYSDTRILNGDPNTNVKRAMLGIDIEVGEIVLADRLREKGEKIDLVIAHHPEGRAMASLYDVMDMQSGILSKYGVPINVAESIMGKRISEIERRLMPANHTRAVDAAKLLDIPFMCVHTPSDNAVVDYLQKIFDKEKPHRVSDIVDMLRDIPEYQKAINDTVAPKVVCGSPKRTAGKIFVDMTGGTGGSKAAYEKLSQAGISTVVGMHMSEEHRKEAEKHHINVLIAGHISSDSLGLNLLFDHVLKNKVDIIPCSGFNRVTKR